MKRHLSDSEPENCDDYEECSSPDTMQISRKKRRGIIEKRRRDRINNCLVELRRLVPAAFEKQGSAKLEKAEILQMTVEHLRHLQSRDPRGFNDPYSPYGNTRAYLDYGIMGFRECTAEIARYMSSMEGVDPKDPLRTRILAHLENLISQKEMAINAAVAASSQLQKAGAPPPLQQTPVSVMPAVSMYAPLTPPRASPDNLSPPASFPTGVTAESLPRFSVAFPVPSTPIISLAPTNGSMPSGVFPSGFKPVIPTAATAVVQPSAAAPVTVVKPAPLVNGLPRQNLRPLTVITSPNNNNTATNNNAATSLTMTTTTTTLSPITPPIDANTTRPEMTFSVSVLPKSPTKTPSNSTKAPFRPWTVTNNA